MHRLRSTAVAINDPDYKKMINDLNQSEKRIRQTSEGLLIKCFLCSRSGRITFFSRKKNFHDHMRRHHQEYFK